MSVLGKEASRVLAITVSSGTGTGTNTKDWARAHWVRVIPVAETDTYDVTIRDADDDIMVKRTGQLGTMSEMLDLSLGILGSVLIENASQDGAFTVKFDMH